MQFAEMKEWLESQKSLPSMSGKLKGKLRNVVEGMMFTATDEQVTEVNAILADIDLLPEQNDMEAG